MPFVKVGWVKGQSAEKRDEVARRITAAVSEVTALPREAIWVVFHEVEAEDWFVGDKSVAQIRSGG